MRPALLLLLLLGCGTVPAGPAPAPVAAPAPTTTTTKRALHVLLTADEHGWLLPLKDDKGAHGGAIALFDRLTRVEGYAPGAVARKDGWVLMSAGDMWTGPYESVVLEGAPMVAAMSRMGYAAAAVGNHEFDFGVRTIAERAKTATFPFLAANLVESANGNVPAWAKPFTIVDVGGMKLGIVGLTNIDSKVTADPRHMTGLEFLPYASTLESWVPRARAAGAEEIVVLLHEALSSAPELMPVFRKLRVRAVAFGHHHVQGSAIDDNNTPDLDDDVVVCNSGAYMRSYCRIDLAFEGPRMTAHDVVIKPVETPVGEVVAGDAQLTAIVSAAEQSANQIGGEVLVENTKLLKRGADGPLGQLVVDAWLAALPYAQVAITNAGGLRQDLPPGPVRVRDVVSVLPFNNYLLVVDLTGAQLKEVLLMPESVVSGVRYSTKAGAVAAVVDSQGNPIGDDAKLKVVINDFMYRGGDRYRFQSWDTEPEETAIDWREPVLRMLREMGKANKKLDVTVDDRKKTL